MITLSKEQVKALEGLAYWIADKYYIIERYGANDPECDRCHKTILLCFDQLDRLKVPFMVQNNVICWAENWRAYKSGYTVDLLKNKGYKIA